MQALPTRLSRAVASTRKKLNPSPPRFNVVLKPSSPTFSLEYLTGTITVPGFWKEFKQKLLIGFLGHEHKHGSCDGLPFNFVNRKKHEAACMATLQISSHQAGRLLNCIYDAVINCRLQEQGFALKEAQQAWANKFPVTQGEGGEYHLLQIVFKHLLNIRLPKTDYEASVEQKPEFKQLLETVRKLIRQQDAMDQEKDVDTIVLGVRLFSELIERKDDDDGEGRLCTDGNDEPVPAELAGEVAEAAADAGLDAGQLKELLNDPDVTEEEAERALNEAEEGRANSAIWHSLIAFKGFEGSGGRTIKEPLLVRWSGHSVSRLDPTSVAVHADDPSKWRERKARPFATIPQPTDDSGFEEVIAVLDMSGSTKLVFGGRQVFAYEKDAVYSVLAFARKQRLSFTLVTFEDDASIVVQRDGDPLKAAKLLSHMRPTDNGSELGPAVSLCVAMHPLRALVVIITDGHVSTGDTAPLLQVSDRNEVVCIVVAPSVTDNALLSAYGDRLTTFQVKPDSAGHALIAQLGARLRKNR